MRNKALAALAAAVALAGVHAADARANSCVWAAYPPGCQDYAFYSPGSASYLHFGNANAALVSYGSVGGKAPYRDACDRLAVDCGSISFYGLAEGAYEQRYGNASVGAKIGIAHPPTRRTCYYAAGVSGPDAAWPHPAVTAVTWLGCTGY